MSIATSPEIGNSCQTGDFATNYHDMGEGPPILMIHGSGPGVSAWANWRGVMPDLARHHRVIAPDMMGFGYTEPAGEGGYSIDAWVAQAIALLDHLRLEHVDLVGNSFGGALSLHLAKRHPERIRRIVLMGAVSTSFELTDGLDKVWGYTPSIDNMRALMNVFAHSKKLINEDLIKLRYEASKQRGMDKVYESLFPEPRQRWVEFLAQSEASLRGILHPTLLIHGREDQVIPVGASIKALELMPNANLLVLSNCGHWTQIEKREEFVHAVLGFFKSDEVRS